MIEVCSIDEAAEIVDREYIMDLEDKELLFLLKACRQWQMNFGSIEGLNNLGKGEALMAHWKRFATQFKEEEKLYGDSFYAFKKGIFSFILEMYLSQEEEKEKEKDKVLKADILMKTGICYKKLGSYERAQDYFREANSLNPMQANILAQWADSFAFCGETKTAKMFFREAFYIDALKIDLDFLDSVMIRELVEVVKEQGHQGDYILHWIPVYGVLMGIFNIRRKLSSHEVLRLKQEIFARENEYKDPSNDLDAVKPRLINLYFWLNDFLDLAGVDMEQINEVHLKLKLLDKDIYKMYMR